MIFWLLACVPKATQEETGDTDPSVDTDPVDTDAEALAADDARVRALTGLPEGDVPCAEPQLVRVRETVDGDTFHAVPEGEERYFSVRVIGVDTPEVAHDDPAECYGNEAWEWAENRLGGRLVWLTFDAECLDIYDRTLAYVFRSNDEDGFFDRALARNGYATPLTIPPNDTYEDEIAADTRAARDEGAGLWSACER
ncbi:MAG: thermonuclease family protein [Pseudomonadota bacterium]|nr:thermonuclease family protein [Pseudomonadota bacterium]